MADVIRFLERLGQDAELRSAPLDQALADAQIEPALKNAIQTADQRLLETLLGAQTNVCCGQHPAKEDEGEDGDEEQDDDGDDDDDDDDDLKSQRFSAPRAASGF